MGRNREKGREERGDRRKSERGPLIRRPLSVAAGGSAVDVSPWETAINLQHNLYTAHSQYHTDAAVRGT